MKKNVMMRLASFLLVAVLISTSAISGTYAKYVTADTATDTARVAEWGVKVDGKAVTMFNKVYTGETYKPNGGTAEKTITVEADEKVVAPGTSGTMSEFTISGNPEVATRVTFDATVELGEKWAVDGVYYCPLIVYVTNNVTGSPVKTIIKGLDYTNAGAFEKAIKDAIDAITVDYAPNSNLADVENDIAISWEWPYENPTEANLQGAAQHQSDVKDTKLGDAAADKKAATITVNVVCTITQIN